MSRRANILVIERSEASTHAQYRGEGRIEWARALPLLLEKHGYLEFEKAPPSVLADPRCWSRHAAILVPELDDEEWSQEAIGLVGSGSASALLELPPPALRRQLEIEGGEAAPRDGTFMPVDAELSEAISARSVLSSTRIEGPRARPIDRDRALDWERLEVPIEPALADAWRRPGWTVQRWGAAAGDEVLAEWVETGGEERRWPGLIRNGSVFATCFSLFGYLGQQLTIAPFEGPEHVVWQRSTGLEAALIALLDQMHVRAGVARTRVMPWPEGAEWVLNVRHDFDREQTRKQVDKVLEAHAAAGSAATWYWRSRHVIDKTAKVGRRRAPKGRGAAVARRVATATNNEVALHTEKLWQSAEAERDAVESAIGRPVRGTSAHGDPSCFRWQGAPNILWAERQGLDYSEFISHSHLVPHRFAALGAEGIVEPLELICLPHHESLDRSTKPGDAAVDQVLAASEAYVRAGGFMQVLNHPDLNLAELRDVLERLPQTGRLDWTAAQVADWWRRSHVASELEVKTGRGGEISVGSKRGVRGLVLETLAPDGTTTHHSLQIDAGDRVVIGPGDAPPPEPPTGLEQWEVGIAPAFAAAARSYYAAHGIDSDSPSSLSTIATNTSLVPGRVSAARRYLRELGGPASLSNLRVLDCGSGFGAFAALLSLGEDAPLVTAVDSRAEFVEIANRVAEETGLEGVSYEAADMRDLGRFDDESFDLIVVNNALIYLAKPGDMTKALREFHRVLAADGRLLLFHANKWQLREPFTRAPLVHMLPRPAADLLSRSLGWEHNHDRVRLVAAPRLAASMRSVGFADVRVGSVVKGRVVGPPRAYYGRFYAIVAGKDRGRRS
jgi:ubiquinone/menaquinone biosynthesis C-methylase UbiE